MASASSSISIPPQPQPPTLSSYTYHVFLSYRGPDTGKGFTNHLYAALVRKGIRTYKDDKDLGIGDVISTELEKTIEESMFAVIVFSPDFASSGWCLDEVCKIVECKNKQRLQMVEVFYHVEPCDVRHQIGTFREAFLKHEQEGFHKSEKIQRWRDALKQVTAHSGWTTKDHPNEASLVENIAQHIFETLIPKLPSSMKNLVGIESRVGQVIRQISLGLNDVRYIGIWGMGGVGKTTIARAVYETIRSRFEVSCFLADVRDRCERKGITDLQKQLIDQMKISSDAVYSDYEGKRIIQNSLRLKKVLLVLDDVNHKKQLENLVGEPIWFGTGSRIIITARDIHLLEEQQVHETYEVEKLVDSEALNLFCLKAFKEAEPTKEFLDLSNIVVKYSGGLPLALEVLGTHLYGRSIEVWHSAIGKIKKSLHSDIIDVLKISFDGLDSMEKSVFLDIACFFKGRGKDYVMKILEGCGHDAEIVIDVLINKSLVTLEDTSSGEVIFGMHDLLEEMGKHMVNQESPNDPSKRSRLWSCEDVAHILKQNKEIEATQSIVLYDMYWTIEGNLRYWYTGDLSLSNLCQLKLLILDGAKVPILCDIPCTLKVLHWRECPMETLPFSDQCYELVEIDLTDSSIVQLWHGKKSLKKLEHLELSCSNLKQTPDLSEAPNLKTLQLEECIDLNYIHPSLTHHKSLVELNLRQCLSLETLGDKLEMSSLKKLDLSHSTRFRNLPEFGKCMKQLSTLSLGFTKIKELPRTFGNLVSLSELDLRVEEGIGFPLSLGCFVYLKELRLSGYNKLSCVPYNNHGLKSLTTYGGYASQLDIDGFLCSLSRLTSLSSLKLNYCFPESEEPIPCYHLGHLALLTDVDLSYNEFSVVPIIIHQLPRLTRLSLYCCDELEVLPELPSSLRELNAQGCWSLDASNVNDVISKTCRVFAESATQDPQDILQMLIYGKEIPAWFEHQEEDNGVTVTFPNNLPSTETLALALCFLVEGRENSKNTSSVICNGKEFTNKRLLQMQSPMSKYKMNLRIVCLNRYCLKNLLLQDGGNHFQMMVHDKHLRDMRVLRCGARWVCKQDIQHLNKTESKKGKGKSGKGKRSNS